MFNIYFAPAWGLSSEQMLDDYKHQTPGGSGVWKDMRATTNVNEADYLVIQDYCQPDLLEKFKPENIYYFGREVPGLGPIGDYSSWGINVFSYVDESSHLYTKWWYPNKYSGGVNKTYDELAIMDQAPVKEGLLSCIQSNKTSCEGHVKRVNFLNEFVSKNNDKLDLFGSISSSNKDLINDDKWEGLAPYKYSIAFDNGKYPNYFGTQFTDAILSWNVPIFWGCPNIEDYFSKDSYEVFDVDNLDEIERIIQFVQSDNYNDRIESLKESRDRILNKYNLWPTIYDAITG
jgi:hypothetical protein